jgi:hypothetical protein
VALAAPGKYTKIMGLQKAAPVPGLGLFIPQCCEWLGVDYLGNLNATWTTTTVWTPYVLATPGVIPIVTTWGSVSLGVGVGAIFGPPGMGVGAVVGLIVGPGIGAGIETNVERYIQKSLDSTLAPSFSRVYSYIRCNAPRHCNWAGRCNGRVAYVSLTIPDTTYGTPYVVTATLAFYVVECTGRCE